MCSKDSFFSPTLLNLLKISLFILKLGYRQSATGFFLKGDWPISRSPLSTVAAVNWQPLRSVSPLTRTKRSRQIQRSTDNKWDFPASRLFAATVQRNHLLEIIPCIQQATNFAGTDEQTGRQTEGRFYIDDSRRHSRGQETNTAGLRPLIGSR